ncbi:quinone-dependent dihydroorotate dehydrogenase [Canibacter sp. lx-72]|uniref:quinone-dependent dihydroorotate dehydrogenase n=1 Tax=Canibacter zhuwentaonis TaxID=2837491 RepID=UPI001BDDB6DA|nr:quinone-dependent dihydroorotate dehydrogenase [Canibacter zhuwentaonis]
MYKLLFNTVLRRLDPEFAHLLASSVIKALPLADAALRPFLRPHKNLRTVALGREFTTPFGLAAGFDKNATQITGLGLLGFGHVEIGTLTMHAQPGNPKPRLFRLVKDSALINRMGFNNSGSAAAVSHITKAKIRPNRPVIGVNIGKSKITPLADAADDYVFSATLLTPFADYLVVNVSSPNTPGLRELQQLNTLAKLVRRVQSAAGTTPVLLKIAPDLSDTHIEQIVTLALDAQLRGIIVTNTTVARDNLSTADAKISAIGAGGLSGKPLATKALQVLRRVRAAVPTESDFTIIAAGGVSSAQDVLERLAAGAHLVQGYSGFIYNGPLWAHKINRELVKLGYRGNAT